MTTPIEIVDDGAVRIITMRRPEKKNALTQAMYATMADAITAAAGETAVRCLMIAGLPGVFCAGNDVEDFVRAVQSPASDHPMSKALDFLRALVKSEKPIVAAVDGLAIGIGTTMLLHCDYVVASQAATFATPFTRLGLAPEGGSSLTGPRLLGAHRAFAMLVMGRTMSAPDAHAAGLANDLVEAGAAEAVARKVAQEIAALPPEGVRHGRRLIRQDPAEMLQRIDDEARIFADRLRSPEAMAAFAAFLSRKD